ncbi:MAG: hypothetical protein HYU05_01255 [Candidatus Wildermuthbacteria bacterium]|nr:hypothetical protein [Candidatus Wildermuthbacteria bacterium]MBI2121307.1 hypothetical protein [Candidatus Wildermuthbacteria bacterium]MBI2647939.1 hypothetical protein [Candidatus Wildermuthbacteria bacterium]
MQGKEVIAMTAEIRLMEARLFGGVDLLNPPTVVTGVEIPVIIRDIAGKTVQVACTVSRVSPRLTNKIEICGTLRFPDGEEKKFHGTLDVSATMVVEY